MELHFSYNKKKVIQALRLHFTAQKEIKILIIIVNVFAIVSAVLFYMHKIQPQPFLIGSLIWILLLLVVWYILPLSIYKKSATFKDAFTAYINQNSLRIDNEKGYVTSLESKGKTPKHSLYAILSVSANLQDGFVQKVEDSKPTKYKLRIENANIPIINTNEYVVIKEQKTEKSNQSKEDDRPEIKKKLEKDLHDYITFFAKTQLDCYCKTIKHQNSKRKDDKFIKWMHPDMVGVSYFTHRYHQKARDLSNSIRNQVIKLYSFELKQTLDDSNLREYYFQAVSNSSWANEGYLAAENISTEPDFLKELNRLSAAFGIGIIQISREDPDLTNVIITAKSKENLDWETINKISSSNPDFSSFLETVKIDYSNIKIHEAEYDKIYTAEELANR
jgi:hypothetical protein